MNYYIKKKNDKKNLQYLFNSNFIYYKCDLILKKVLYYLSGNSIFINKFINIFKKWIYKKVFIRNKNQKTFFLKKLSI